MVLFGNCLVTLTGNVDRGRLLLAIRRYCPLPVCLDRSAVSVERSVRGGRLSARR